MAAVIHLMWENCLQARTTKTSLARGPKWSWHDISFQTSFSSFNLDVLRGFLTKIEIHRMHFVPANQKPSAVNWWFLPVPVVWDSYHLIVETPYKTTSRRRTLVCPDLSMQHDDDIWRWSSESLVIFKSTDNYWKNRKKNLSMSERGQKKAAFSNQKVVLAKVFNHMFYPSRKLTWQAGKSSMNEDVLRKCLFSGGFCPVICWEIDPRAVAIRWGWPILFESIDAAQILAFERIHPGLSPPFTAIKHRVEGGVVMIFWGDFLAAPRSRGDSNSKVWEIWRISRFPHLIISERWTFSETCFFLKKFSPEHTFFAPDKNGAWFRDDSLPFKGQFGLFSGAMSFSPLREGMTPRYFFKFREMPRNLRGKNMYPRIGFLVLDGFGVHDWGASHHL